MKNEEQNSVLLGYSTTLAENTVSKSLRSLVDWVTVSFSSANNWFEIYNAVLGIEALEKVEIIDGARYDYAGYNVTYRLGNIDLMHDESKSRYLLNMSGQGCREFELLSKYDITTLFYMLKHLLPKFTRLDIAIDDFKGIYNVSTIRKAVNKGCCVSKLKTCNDNVKKMIANPKEILMDNFYLGTRTSRYFINFYDKKMERINNKQPLPKYIDENGNLKEIETWTRTEVRFKYEYAQDFVGHILFENEEKPLGHFIIGFLKSKLVFLSPKSLKKDSNRSRLAKDEQNHARWWTLFTRDVEKLPLTITIPENSLAKNLEWLFKQVSTSLAMLNVYEPESYSDLLRMLTTTGNVRLQKRHLNKVMNQLILDGLSPDEANQIIEHKLDNVVTLEQIQQYKERQTEIIQSRTLKNVMDIYWDKLEEQIKEENKVEYSEDDTDLINYYQDLKEIKIDNEVSKRFHKQKKIAHVNERLI